MIRCKGHQVKDGAVSLVFTNGTKNDEGNEAEFLATLNPAVARNIAPSIQADQWHAVLSAFQQAADFALKQAQGEEPIQPTAAELLSTTNR